MGREGEGMKVKSLSSGLILGQSVRNQLEEEVGEAENIRERIIWTGKSTGQ